MPGAPIIVTGSEAATNNDILNATRLVSPPSAGLLTMEFQSDLNVAANNFALTIQLPDGSTPANSISVPAGTVGQLDERTLMRISALVSAGGHAVISLVETGTAIVTWRVTFSPF